MVKKIISHKKPHHADDFFAISILKIHYDVPIELKVPQEISQEEINDPHILLIDVGGEYNPELLNFDHHQDINLPCSLVLVLNWLPIEDKKIILNSTFLKGIDVIDRKGPKGLLEVGISLEWNEELDTIRKIILSSEPHPEIGKTFLEVCKMNLSYQDSWKTLFQILDEKKLLEQGKEKIEKEEKLYQEKKAKVIFFDTKKGKVAFSYETLAPHHQKFFKETEVILLIEKNSMKENHTSIIKNTQLPETKDIDLLKVFSIYPKVFIHQNGFIAVIDVEINKVSVDKILEVLLSE
ncbi:MAG: hypothetical protein C0169_02740 [Thermodesulfobacterium geofontis]|uniref:Uncharacterized protein n=1 Tax=Thermodesulfobacterium geofontis TaxID=1295609 RepID=A0A2N7QFE2_9BACT|nr:MAG: hypothetical protein C0169_02740 [Thermodesulfobacterium geofontis]